jgi:Tol biopolymer transport system component
VVFLSNNALVPDDTNGTADIYVRDRLEGTTQRVSVDSDGNQRAEFSTIPRISGSGRYVAFLSQASFVPEDSNSHLDVYRHDLVTGETELVSANLSGQAPKQGADGRLDISADGRWVVFSSRAHSLTAEEHAHRSIFVRDMDNDVTNLVSINRVGNAANHRSDLPSISDDGRFICFNSNATNLKGAHLDNRAPEIFVRDMTQKRLELISVDRNGAEPTKPSGICDISNNGRFVAFDSTAPNLTAGDTDQNNDVLMRDRRRNSTTLISIKAHGDQTRRPSWRPRISPDGNYVTYTSEATLVPGELNDARDAYLWNRQTKTNAWVSAAPVDFQDGDASYAEGVSRGGTVTAFMSTSGFVAEDTNRPGGDDVYAWVQGPGT